MPVIKLYANLRKLAGTKEESLSGETVGAILNELVIRHPSLAELILENAQPRRHVVVTVNGNHTSDMNMQVTEQDVLAVFPPIAGGTSPLALRELPTKVPARRAELRRRT
jgi:MoaD family protein, archaeal